MKRGVPKFLSYLVARGDLLAACALICVFGVVAVMQGSVAFARDVTLAQPTVLNSNAPRNIPSDYVVTPDGYFHPSCVDTVAPDESLDAYGNIINASGIVRHLTPCAYPHYAPNGERLQGDALPRVSRFATSASPTINGWVVTGQYPVQATSSASYLSAEMGVPAPPPVQSGQVIYFFPGLEDFENVVTIVQPVLAWNGFNDNGWTIASWNCCRNGRALHSAPVAVSTGDTILGRMKGVRCASGSCALWSILSSDVTSGESTTLNTSSYGQVFDWIFGGVLEAYGVSQCGHFPNATTEDFTGISVKHGNRPFTPPWQQMLIANSPACGYSAAGFPNVDSPNVRLTY
ncbi:MAG: hypothetical protein ACRESC_06475 [Gammaproteobacteria bacterium]